MYDCVNVCVSVCVQVSQLVLLARQCGEETHSTSQALAAVRYLVGEIDLTAALVTASHGQGRREEGGKEGGKDFESLR